MTVSLNSFVQDLKKILQTLLPKGRTELSIFIGLLLFYFSYSVYIVFSSYVIDHQTIDTDLYFSFDNPIILKYGRTQITGHPLIYIFYYPLVVIGNFLAYLIGYKAKTLLFVLSSNMLISMSCVYIHRYLKEIAKIESKGAIIITLIFAFFFTNMILAFTPESFTLSAFFLPLSLYFYSSYIKRGKSPSTFSSIVLADICLGGVTITNMAKGVIPILFLKEKFSSIIKRIFIVGITFFLILCSIQVASLLILDKNFFASIITHRQLWTPEAKYIDNYFDYIFSYFYSIPIFFSELTSSNFYNPATRTENLAISEMAYAHWSQYIVGLIILVSIIFGVIRNFKNKFVWMICLLLGFDLFLHIALRFGLFGPFIYGAHWIYCIPILLGWMYKSLSNKCAASIYFCILCCLFVALAINNSIQIYKFAELAKQLFPIN